MPVKRQTVIGVAECVDRGRASSVSRHFSRGIAYRRFRDRGIAGRCAVALCAWRCAPRWGRIREALAEFEAAERSGLRERDVFRVSGRRIFRWAAPPPPCIGWSMPWRPTPAAGNRISRLPAPFRCMAASRRQSLNTKKSLPSSRRTSRRSATSACCRIAIGRVFEAAERAFRQVIDRASERCPLPGSTSACSLFRQDRIDARQEAIARAQELAAKATASRRPLQSRHLPRQVRPTR